MKVKRLNQIPDFFGCDGFSDENLFYKIISPLNKNVDEIRIKFESLIGMYEFEKALVERLDYFNNKYSSEDVCPPIQEYQRIADEKKLNYIIRKQK